MPQRPKLEQQTSSRELRLCIWFENSDEEYSAKRGKKLKLMHLIQEKTNQQHITEVSGVSHSIT